MFVSILQLLGFTSAKPVHSRAGEIARPRPESAGNAGITLGNQGTGTHERTGDGKELHAQASTARRTDLKAKVTNQKAPSRAGTKAPPTRPRPVAAKVSVKATSKAARVPAEAPARSVKPTTGPARPPARKDATPAVGARPPAKGARPDPKGAAQTVAKPITKSKASAPSTSMNVLVSMGYRMETAFAASSGVVVN